MGDSSSSSNTSQTSTLNPWSQQQYQNVSGGVNNTLNGNYSSSYQPYTGQMTAGLTGMQNQAMQMAQNNANAGTGLLNQASTGATSGQAYSPSTVTPQTLASTNLSSYENPYTSDVVNTTMSQLDQQRQNAINNNSGQYTSNGAFGGSRQGVSDALTNQYYGNIEAQTLAGLNNQNYTQAQNAAQSDISNNLQGQLANQSAGIQGANLNLGASSLLGNLANTQQQLGLNSTNEVNALGTQQQSTNNAALQAAYNEYLRGQISPTEQAQLQLGLLGETPMLTSSTGTSSTSTSPSLMSSLGQGVGMASLLFSDERAKEGVVEIGRDEKGRRWVSYTYRNNPAPQVGVIAQEVQKTDPEAVIEHPVLGFLMVDYSKLKAA